MKDKFADKLNDYDKLEDDCRKKYKMLLSNHVIDADKSVKWNREEVERLNEETKAKLREAQEECRNTYSNILDEIFTYYKEEYPEILKTFRQFKYILDKSKYDCSCYGYHSVMEDFEGKLDEIDEFIKLGETE